MILTILLLLLSIICVDAIQFSAYYWGWILNKFKKDTDAKCYTYRIKFVDQDVLPETFSKDLHSLEEYRKLVSTGWIQRDDPPTTTKQPPAKKARKHKQQVSEPSGSKALNWKDELPSLIQIVKCKTNILTNYSPHMPLSQLEHLNNKVWPQLERLQRSTRGGTMDAILADLAAEIRRDGASSSRSPRRLSQYLLGDDNQNLTDRGIQELLNEYLLGDRNLNLSDLQVREFTNAVNKWVLRVAGASNITMEMDESEEEKGVEESGSSKARKLVAETEGSHSDDGPFDEGDDEEHKKDDTDEDGLLFEDDYGLFDDDEDNQVLEEEKSDEDGLLFEDDYGIFDEDDDKQEVLEEANAEIIFPPALPPKVKGSTETAPPVMQSKAGRIPVLSELNEHFFLRWKWPDRILVREGKLSDSGGLGIQNTFNLNGSVYSLLSVKLLDNTSYSRYTYKVWKAYYIKVSGPGVESLDLKEEMSKIADFQTLPPRKIVSRFELLVSTTAYGKAGKARVPYQFLLETDKFEMIPEDSNIGCGFFPEALLEQLLGKGIDAAQIRVISPALGVFKGMMMRKTGITKIQLPGSMQKVGASKSKLHSFDGAYVLVNAVFPTKSSEMIGRRKSNAILIGLITSCLLTLLLDLLFNLYRFESKPSRSTS